MFRLSYSPVGALRFGAICGYAMTGLIVTATLNNNNSLVRYTVREARQVHMVVLKTQEEAEAVKTKIGAGEITIYEAARDHSIDPKAKQTLGEMGWVVKGTGRAGWSGRIAGQLASGDGAGPA